MSLIFYLLSKGHCDPRHQHDSRRAMTMATARRNPPYLLAFILLFLILTVAFDDTCQETSACAAGDVIVDEEKVPRLSTPVSSNDVLHISANGDHKGWIVHVPKQENGSILPCHLHMAKWLVAEKIVAEYHYEEPAVRQVDLRGPHRLVDEEGKAFPEETTSHRLHLLLPREAFIHEAVEEGFVRTLSDGITKLTTLSLNPRVFLVDPMLSKKDCRELIDISAQSLQKSPEKHYSDAYKNYRTSWTGSTPSDSPLTRKLWNRVKYLSAMPDGGVEHPQLLKYDTNTSWYKQHHDFYHHFESRPLEEVRMFVQTRAHELVRLKVSSNITRVLGDGSSIDEFDPIKGAMRNELASTLLKALHLERIETVSAQRQLHDYLVASPMQEFGRVARLYAVELLRANGASDPTILTEQYFLLEGVKSNNGVMPFYDIEDYVPYVLKPIQCNRHVTLLPVLQAADRGGNTAFPNAKSNKMGITPDHDEEFEECKRGLVVKAESGQALMFYNRLPRGDLDYSTIHAGCPPKEGEKFAVNCFTWDSDSNRAFKFLTEIDRLY